MNDFISRNAAIDALQKEINKGKPPFDDTIGAIRCGVRLARNIIEDLPSAQSEPLTDKEQRIFLAAMGREEKVCAEIDRNFMREPYEDSLMYVCKEIRRKVKGALWT